jgi:tetratricopeptide (TPR) repeat protein
LSSKHGCLLVGEPQSGKSTLIGLLESALNKAAMNEYTLTVQDRRKAAMLRLAKAHEKQAIAAKLAKMANLDGGAGMSSDMIGGAVKKNRKKNDKDHQAKKLLALYQDMYRKTKLSEEELQEIRENLGTKGVIMRRMNPKGMTQEEMFGTYDALSHEWREGLFSQEFRNFANMADDKKKWILLDGPIDYSWVENLNSILDDNRKMSLPNGEQIKMSQGMCILLETDNMKNVTPATVSRCGLIYLHKGETSESKAIFNQWLRNLPPNLQEYQTELENAANFLMVEAIAVFEAEKKASKLVFGDVDLHWLMQSFVRLLTTLVFDYFLEFEKSNAMNIAAQNPFELGKSLQNLTLGNAWTDTKMDPNATMLVAGSDAADSHPASKASSRPASQARVETPDVQARAQGKRLPKCNFMDSELRYENALKFTPIWLEAFVIFSIVWTFSPIFSDSGKK